MIYFQKGVFVPSCFYGNNRRMTAVWLSFDRHDGKMESFIFILYLIFLQILLGDNDVAGFQTLPLK